MEEKTDTSDPPQQEDPPVALDSMLRCYSVMSWDSAVIHDALINTWEWEFIKCYWKPEDANGEDFKGLSVQFKQNDSLEVKLNNQLTQVSSWSIVRLNDEYFKLSTSPFIPQLPGKILLCGDRILFYDSYVDGCDNYFKKQN